MKKIAQSLVRLSLSKTARNTYSVTFGNGVSAFLAFVFTVIIARILSLDDLGYFSALMSFILLTTDVAELGIGTSLARFLPPLEKDKNTLQRFYITAFLAQVCVSTVLLAVIFVSAPHLASIVFRRTDFAFLIQLTGIAIVGSIMSNFYLYTLLARQRFGYATAYMISTGLIRLVFLFIIIIFFSPTITNFVYMQMGSLIIGAVIGQLICGFEFLRFAPNWKDLKKLVSFSKFLGAARSLTAIAGKLDVLLLVSLAGPAEAGIYAIAAKIIAIYPLLSGSFSSVIAPRLSSINQYFELKKFVWKVIMGTLFFISTIFFMIAISDPFIRIFFPNIVPAIPVFRLLLVAMIFFVGSVPSVSIAVYYLKKPWILTVNSVFQVAIVWFGNVLLIPILGRFAPAYVSIAAFGLTWFTTSVLSLIYLKKHHAA